MAALLVALVIFIPWLGAIIVVLVGDIHPKAQHVLAGLSAMAAALARGRSR